MVTLLVYAVALFLAVLISERAERSVISTAVLFLVAGFLSGGDVLGLVQLRADHPVVENLSMLALFSVLLTDGMRIDVQELRKAWHLPGRALLAGMPLGFGVTLLLAHFVGGLSWRESLLISGVLAPTDPVFAAAIVGRKEIPQRVRRLLNVESGVNDGLALPVIVWMLASFRHAPPETASLFGSVVFGVALGIFVAWLALRIERSEWFAASSVYEPFDVVAVGLVIFAAASLTGANPYLAAFAAGITITSSRRPAPEPSRLFGERVTELLKLAGLLVLERSSHRASSPRCPFAATRSLRSCCFSRDLPPWESLWPEAASPDVRRSSPPGSVRRGSLRCSTPSWSSGRVSIEVTSSFTSLRSSSPGRSSFTPPPTSSWPAG